MGSPGELESSLAYILRMTCESMHCAIALIARAEGERLLIEQACPSDGLSGLTLKVPTGLLGLEAQVLHTQQMRLSLDWTQACRSRPAYIAAVPLPHQRLHLVLAGRERPPRLKDLQGAAHIMSQMLAAGQLTQLGRESARRIRALVDSLPFPLVFVDSHTDEVLLNAPARALLRLTERPSSGNVVAALRDMVADSDGAVLDPFALDPKVALTLALEREDHAYEVSSEWIDHAQLRGRLWMFRDITVEREARRFKEELVSNVSHELRTPLTAIIGSLTMLRAGVLDERPDETASIIALAERNAQRLARIVNDLLDTEKHGQNRLDISMETTELYPLLSEAVQLNQPYARDLGIKLALDTPDEPIFALVDRDRLIQVLTNLLSNAAKFSHLGGTVCLRLSATVREATISVIDQGRGMSESFMTQLFTRFAQEDAGKAVPRQGTGLGLAISKTIVEQLKGKLSVESQLDVGTSFHIALPRR